ncbi:Flp pilus assembly protein CpaB [Idiomarina sp. HP20-50]|uniref:Flp pilus assembly protein CpaB n=1 Tax=Idiomarina sp. HP20-50 TaxID=3070813 RepID=UPI00294B6992|nr:Flp pilus assembly protein CpaB [Idiomarina sp. HP20-50]MDV6315441.1 Flp pilus assembly protein CpaB [Idiomarina sp. HP20-50]
MTRKAKWIFAVVFSVLLSIVTVVLIHQYLQRETSRRLEQASGNARNVVVFASELQAGKALNANDLLVRKYPEELISAQWYLESSAGMLIGRQLRSDVQPGEPVSERVLSSNLNNGLSAKLPNGYYAITVETDNLGHHNAMLKTGDVVDIVFVGGSFEQSRQYTAFDNIEIFDVYGVQENFGTYSLTLLIESARVRDFTRALGNPMLVWAREHSSPNVDIWAKGTKQSKVAPWKVQ